MPLEDVSLAAQLGLEDPAIALASHNLYHSMQIALFLLQGLLSRDKHCRVMSAGKEITVTSKNETLKVVALEDGSSAVVRIDPANPRLLEVVATFYDAARAQQYAELTGVRKARARGLEAKLPVAKVAEPKLPAAKVARAETARWQRSQSRNCPKPRMERVPRQTELRSTSAFARAQC